MKLIYERNFSAQISWHLPFKQVQNVAEIFLEAVGGAGRPPRKVFIFNLFGNAAAGS
jgi:hypothetical protein